VLLAISRGIDKINDQFGVAANWCVLLSALISCAESLLGFFWGSTKWLTANYPALAGVERFFQPIFNFYQRNSVAMIDTELYLFGGMVMLGAAYTLKVNEHVRVDLFYGMASERGRLWIDILGTLFFLLPMCFMLIYFSWGWFVQSWVSGEVSADVGSLVRWPIRLMLPFGFSLIILQAVSELIKRFESLRTHRKLHFDYETPLQ
jgi:TRAP-type mannitol/chloroaromatic compound transport system permease small subunit